MLAIIRHIKFSEKKRGLIELPLRPYNLLSIMHSSPQCSIQNPCNYRSWKRIISHFHLTKRIQITNTNRERPMYTWDFM